MRENERQETYSQDNPSQFIFPVLARFVDHQGSVEDEFPCQIAGAVHVSKIPVSGSPGMSKP